MATRKPNVIFVVGVPGAGKGTQCKQIAKMYDYVHISIGDILRVEAAKPGSVLGKEINDHMKNGSLVPSDITCKLLENVMRDSDEQNFLIDGFPRDRDNINEWQKIMDDRVNIQCFLVFDCDEKVAIDRCLERGKKSGRSDDNEENIKKRIDTFNKLTQSAIQFYERDNLVKRIDASNDVDKVLQNVQIVMKNFKLKIQL